MAGKALLVHSGKKRSFAVGFTALGSASMLAGCGIATPADEQAANAPAAPKSGDSDKVYAYRSVGECAAAKIYSEQKCQEAYNEAAKENEKSAKSYADKQACEEQYGTGNCERRGPRFSGVMAGYIIARSLDGNRYAYGGLYNDRKSGMLSTSGAPVMQNGEKKPYSIGGAGFASQNTVGKMQDQRRRSSSSLAASGGFGGRSIASAAKVSGGSRGG
ncbi:MAG: DUF1190 domain-containing protein [Sphingomonadales bacterium]|nr:DUF1190 domain-containing protein [Sphingomonadales bacterium]